MEYRPNLCALRPFPAVNTGRYPDFSLMHGVAGGQALPVRTPDERHRPRHPPVHCGGHARRGGHRAYISYWHAYAVVRAHGETGITARLAPATIDGLVYASSMVVLYAARHRVPVPSLDRWLLGLGIGATLTANMAQGWSHSLAGALIAAWPTVSLVGSYELS